MKLFITGGSGFVGQNLIPILIKNNFEVLALARSQKAADKVQKLGATPVRDDLTALSKNTALALQQCDYVLHSAAMMDFTYDPKPFYTMNVEATKSLLDLAKKAGVKKFIYISAAPVVPGSPIINLKENEAQTGLPTALYPKTKAIAEQAVLAANTPQFQTIALRPPAIWGPNNHHFEDLLSAVKEGKWRWIGGSQQILSTIHIRNLGNAVLAGLKSDKGGEAYFVTDGDRRSMKTTFEKILKAQGLNPGEKTLPRPVAAFVANFVEIIWKTFGIKSRPPIAPLMIRLMGTEFSVNDEKARKELGYKNVISFDEGIQEIANLSQ